FLGQLLHLLESLRELEIRALERLTGLDAELPREIHGRKEQVSDLFFYLFPSASDPLLFQLRSLFFHLRHRSLCIRPIEPDPGGALLEPVRHEQRRQRRRKTRQRTALAAGARLAPFDELPPRVIVAADPTLAEEIRMPPPHLLLECARDDFRVELRPLFRDDDLKREMQQQVAQLVAHRFGIVGLDRLIELERFLDQIGTECLRALRAVPRTPLSQLAHESQSTSKR